MFVAWTTVASREEADRLAGEIIARRLAACVQVEGPVTSIFRWQGRVEQTEEFRLSIKHVAAQSAALAEWVRRNHPYEVPEWIVVRADSTGEKYLSWAESDSTSPPL